LLLSLIFLMCFSHFLFFMCVCVCVCVCVYTNIYVYACVYMYSFEFCESCNNMFYDLMIYDIVPAS
jgi:hypothetical protein